MYGSEMSRKLPVSSFKWVKKLSKFDEHSIKDYDENSNKGYFFWSRCQLSKKFI